MHYTIIPVGTSKVNSSRQLWYFVVTCGKLFRKRFRLDVRKFLFMAMLLFKVTGRTKGSRNITGDRAKWATHKVCGWSGCWTTMWAWACGQPLLAYRSLLCAPIGPSLGTGNFTAKTAASPYLVTEWLTPGILHLLSMSIVIQLILLKVCFNCCGSGNRCE